MPDADTIAAHHVNQQQQRRTNAANRAKRPPSWPWALGSIASVLVILVGAFIGRHLIQTAQQPPIVSAPTTQPLSVVAVTSPHTSYQLSALDAASGHLVALASDAALDCPPPAVGDCPSAPPLTAFTIVDGATASPIATTPLTGTAAAAAQSVALLADSATHRAYAVAPHAVVVFSTTTGAALATYALPPDTPWQRESGATLDPVRNILYLVGSGQALALDGTTGRILVRQPLPASATVEGPALDPVADCIYLLLRDTSTATPTLAAYDTATLALREQRPLPIGTRLGPLYSSGHALFRALYLYDAGGAIKRLTLSSPLPFEPARDLQDEPELRGSLALGWNDVPLHFYAAKATSLTVDAFGTANPIGALPLRVAWNPAVPLLVDAIRGLLYFPDMRGVITIARDPTAATAATSRLTPGAAALLARAALAHFLPDTHQDPPFLSPTTFPLSDGSSTATRSARYWINFSDLATSSDLGWRGPYPGTAQTSVTSDTARAGGYLITFNITWDQLFTRTHTWICAVAPDGSVRLRSDSGDVVP